MRVASLIAMAIVRTIPAFSGNENCLITDSVVSAA
ncbi:unnamed protein product [Callosobruchus maculatus]|uniref:Uncharacterized protein n=1 Tax=Callosobruchus maculatus TaxID=64391 RepID=A0A653DB76_CALMS|nr:unnamed protein product [Callosobruchus maculatus]